jgi:hypothetical protein
MKGHLRRCVRCRRVHPRCATATTPRPQPDRGTSQHAGDNKRGGQRAPKPFVLEELPNGHVIKGLPCQQLRLYIRKR